MSHNNSGPSREELWQLAAQRGPIKREDIGLTHQNSNRGPSREELWQLAAQRGPIKREDIRLTNQNNTTNGLSTVQEGTDQWSHGLYE